MKYYWYKFTVLHGPGHQSKSERYFHSTTILNRSTRDDLIYEEGHKHDPYYVPMVTLRRVSSVPLHATTTMRFQTMAEIKRLQEKLLAIDEVED